ncbi:hypothetical protein EG832_11885 [bacterium]|nr:hypothetical protein [bacterium]
MILYLFSCLWMDVLGQPESVLPLTGPYLGQKPPGSDPEIFAPGIISRPGYFEHSAALFTPDGKEVYWTAKANDQRDYRIYSMIMVNGIWSRPDVASFCREGKYYQDCILSSDGKRLYFTDGNSWQFVEKQSGNWSIPLALSKNLTSGADINICSVTNDGSVYFIKRPEFDAYVSRAVKGGHAAPEKLPAQVNSSDSRENRVYVTPDEGYMIIEATKDGATCELFISFRKEDRSWSERKKLPIPWGRFPSVSPDGKYLFFMTRDGIWWVSATILETAITDSKN